MNIVMAPTLFNGSLIVQIPLVSDEEAS
jgi:hypothetical protein